jgi:TldD protein
MADLLNIAQQQLLAPAELTESKIQRVLGSMLGNHIDSAELYFQNRHSESWILEDGIVKEANYNIERGVGVRALSGEKTGFAYADDIVLPTLENIAGAARSIAFHQGEGKLKATHKVHSPALYQPENPLQSLSEAAKIELLQRVDREARQCDPRIVQVNATLSGVHDIILNMNSDGQMAADVRPLVRLNVSVIAQENGKREQGFAGGGGRRDYCYFIEADRALELAREAVRIALVNLHARPAPAGVMPIVMGSGWSGVLLHEAVGHGLEGDFNRKGVSAFSNRIGQQVASPLCTIVDDGTLAGRRGSLSIDDEGTPAECTMLIEKGILKGYMQDKLNARLMGMKATGNGRRESYAHMPMPRMTNTYMLPGQQTPEEIIASVDKGLYIKSLGGGSVDITSGKFVFSTSEAYLIENGKITHAVKGATLIGNGPDVMQKVSMVGNDLTLDPGVGICGKEGQSVPVGVGQPTIRIDSMTVGGTEN